MPKGDRIEYSAPELAYIEARSTLPRAELHRLFCAFTGRTDVSQANLTSLCKRRGWLTGRTGQFVTGQASHNKGRTGWCAPGSEKGWFKPGVRLGVAKRVYQPIGTERVSKDGYIQRKVNDDLPFQRRWRGVHLICWEAVHGPLPPGRVLKCLDGDRTNTDPANWVLIPRGMLPRLAGGAQHQYPEYDAAPAELKPSLLAVARLEQAARERRQKTDRRA